MIVGFGLSQSDRACRRVLIKEDLSSPNRVIIELCSKNVWAQFGHHDESLSLSVSLSLWCCKLRWICLSLDVANCDESVFLSDVANCDESVFLSDFANYDESVFLSDVANCEWICYYVSSAKTYVDVANHLWCWKLRLWCWKLRSIYPFVPAPWPEWTSTHQCTNVDGWCTDRILFSIPVPSLVDFFSLPFLSPDLSFFFGTLFSPRPPSSFFFFFVFAFETFPFHPPSHCLPLPLTHLLTYKFKMCYSHPHPPIYSLYNMI